MNIKELLGEAYKEGMTVEEIETALADKSFVDPSTLPPSVSKETFDKTAADLAKAKKTISDMQSANLTDEEKVKQALADAKEAEEKFNRKSIRLDVEKVLVQGGLSEKDYEGVIDSFVTLDRDSSIAAANNLIKMIAGQKEAAEAAVKAQLQEQLKNTPKGKENGEVTKEDFDKMTYSEQLAFMETHPDIKF